jgi:hypothetical protein
MRGAGAAAALRLPPEVVNAGRDVLVQRVVTAAGGHPPTAHPRCGRVPLTRLPAADPAYEEVPAEEDEVAAAAPPVEQDTCPSPPAPEPAQS